jgi:hypothetical protein
LQSFCPNPDKPEPNRKKFFVSGFYESPGLKTKGLNPGDSANPDTTIKSLLFLHRFNFKVTKDGRENVNSDERRAVRGGSWFLGRYSARCAYRRHYPSDAHHDGLGFRVVIAPKLE